MPLLRRPTTLKAAIALVFALLVAAIASAAASSLPGSTPALAAGPVVHAPSGQGFDLNDGDMRYILKQIKIAEHHATTESGPGQPLVGPGEFQIANPLLPYGLRTVDGSENNLQPGQDTFGAVDQKMPRLAPAQFRAAEDSNIPGLGPVGAPGQTTYASKNVNVVDSQPRMISNLIVDQTSANPAAVIAAGHPHRTFTGTATVPCTAPGVPVGCTPPFQTLFIPNVTTDVGLSPPYNSWFTYFGQFFDHGVDSTSKANGSVFVPLKDDDPLVAGPDHVFGNADDLPPSRRFMVLTRTKNLPGPDGISGNADDIQEATNTDTPWVDQSQTYTSHSSHQVFVREYAVNGAGQTVSTGKLLTGPGGGMANWATVKAQAAALLGIQLVDSDVLNIPLLATDQYGRYLRGPARGLPQIVTTTGLVEGNRTTPVLVPANAKRLNTAFLDDIANGSKPSPGLTPDANTTIDPPSTDPAGTTYDNEMLDAHYIAGDGRVNENIGLTAVHQIFHSEHNRLVDYMKDLITTQGLDLTEWQVTPGVWNGERLFQAGRFVTEMEYQHLVFEEFARKIQPAIDPFNAATQSATDINPAVRAEFAHAVYRFGHSMLTDTIDRTNFDGSKNNISLLNGFLNPPAFLNGGSAGPLNAEQAVGSIVAGETDQVGNELDEFVADTLRNNLLGLPLDLPSLNMARARDAGVPSLNNLRKQLFLTTNDGALKPYANWVDFSLALKHPASTVNFIAAYGKHPTITAQTTIAGKRAAAQKIYDNNPLVPGTPADSADFVNSLGAWANTPAGDSTTGLDDVDLWVGGLAEAQNLNGGLLGSTFNYVFEQQLTDLQNGDRLYYLSRTPGTNLRTQLEGNSFAELIERNSDAHSLKADVFAAADCEFELANLAGTTPGTIADDPSSHCDESKLLIRMADGTIRYRTQNEVDPPGINSQSTYNGTAGADKVQGGVDTDTIWGNEGNDRIDGADGPDRVLGGDGNDIITDSAGDDVLKGGKGNDAIDGGPGIDILMSGYGSDFTDGGMNANETFAGEGNDFILAGNGADTVQGDGGDDWMEGGNANDLLQGDNGAPFFDDINTAGNDVLIGDGGEDDYDAEGGDDIMVAGPGVERNAGIRGFDWSIHRGDPQAADDDLSLAIALLPAPVVTVRDRYTDVEALSGWKFDDILRGDRGPHPAGNDLDAAGIARIAGLQAVVGAGVTSFSGNNNILLGGAGNDTFEGRGGDDTIDGDKWLNVQLKGPDQSTPSPTDTRLADSMTSFRSDVFSGKTDPGDISIVRTIETSPTHDLDTAIFSGPRADYDITPNLNTTEMKVAHVRGAASDGTDTLRNVERLQFSDQTVTLGPLATLSPNRTYAAQQLLTTSAAQSVTLSNTGNSALTIASIVLAGTNPGDFAISSNACGATLAAGSSCLVNVTFRPTAIGTRAAILRATDDSANTPGSTQDVTLTGVGQVAPPANHPATGGPQVSDATPQLGQTLTAITTAIVDLDGLGPFSYQWQQTNQIGGTAFTNIAGATNPTLAIPAGIAGVTWANRRLRVVVSFTDGAGFAESRTSNQTSPISVVANATNAATVAPLSLEPASTDVPLLVAPLATAVADAVDAIAPGAVGTAPSARASTTASLRATGLRVTARQPIAVGARMPAGASTVRVAVYRLARTHARRVLVGAEFHAVPAGGSRASFPVRGARLRHLAPGRYVVEVRCGTSRTALGPVVTRAITIRR